jgi:cell division protein FtsL
MNGGRLAVLALLVVLVAANVGTGAALIMSTHRARALHQEYELLKSEEDRLQGDWSALRIEVGTHAGHSEIDRIARDQLGMIEPDDNLRYIEVVR